LDARQQQFTKPSHRKLIVAWRRERWQRTVGTFSP
jgi:hypothetical protein